MPCGVFPALDPVGLSYMHGPHLSQVFTKAVPQALVRAVEQQCVFLPRLVKGLQQRTFEINDFFGGKVEMSLHIYCTSVSILH